MSCEILTLFSQIFMMHIKQHNSDDLCFSPTYSLLCSVAIPVERFWVKKSSRNQTGKHCFYMQLHKNCTTIVIKQITSSGNMTKTCSNKHYNNDIILVYYINTQPASGPLSCYRGCSSTHHPHAALWPPLSSWTSSENNFSPETKLWTAQSLLNASKISYNSKTCSHTGSMIHTTFISDSLQVTIHTHDYTFCTILDCPAVIWVCCTQTKSDQVENRIE